MPIAYPHDPLLCPSILSPPLPSLSRGPLHAGAVFEGHQKSGRTTYSVRVRLDSVDLNDGILSGLLEIKGLTPDLESLETFFEGEIIGEKGPGFLTSRWGASEADDLKHWGRFAPFRGLKNQLHGPNLNYNVRPSLLRRLRCRKLTSFRLQKDNRPFLFMRWKEQFVVPGAHVKTIHGASFAGFYYVLLDFSTPLCTPIPSLLLSPPPRAFGLSPSLSPPSPRLSPPLSPTSTGEPSPTPPPPRPRRASSASLSYASVLRGSPETSTPKDVDLASSPIVIPIPLGQQASDFPAPSSRALMASASWGRGRGRRREGARSLDALVLDEEEGKGRRWERRGSTEKEKDTHGMKSWSSATMTGRVPFRCL